MNLSKWLIASYMYYSPKYESFLTDAEFDKLSEELLKNWETLEHIHKFLVTEENLKCQTCVGIEFPTIVKVCADVMYKKYKETGAWDMQGFE